MIKDIKYNGFSVEPADYECGDGSLAASLNLISEDNQLKPIFQPKVKITLGENYRIVLIHEISATKKHYIVHNTSTGYLYWMETTRNTLTEDDNHKIGNFYTITNMTIVGNTLIVFANKSINYFLWQNNTYLSLGNHIPNISISFGLRGRPRFYSVSDDSPSTFTINFNGISSDALYNPWTQENKTRITSQVMAKVNKFLREQTVNKGRFALPFFVRYALRLYDGSLVCHSAPILMNPSTKSSPLVYWKRITGRSQYTDAECDIMLVASSLDYVVSNQWYSENATELYNLQNRWNDIVKSVDVFISKPIYTWDQDGECTSFKDADNFDTKFIGRLVCEGVLSNNATPQEDKVLGPINVGVGSGKTDATGFDEIYTEWTYNQIYSLYKSADRTYPGACIHLPEFTEDKIAETIRSTADFYLLCSIDIKDLATSERKEIIVGDEYLQSLVTRERMTDDYLSHDKLQAQFAHTYNGRLNLAGVKRMLFGGFMAFSMLSYINYSSLTWRCASDTHNVTATVSPFNRYNISITVYIRENGNIYAVSANDDEYLGYFLSSMVYTDQTYTNGSLAKRSWGTYLFYPNVNAFKMIIRDGEGAYVIDLKPHEFLNGAYALLDYELQREANLTANSVPQITTTPIEGNWVDMPNKIYTSEINNPFFFPLLGINAVGTGTILGISTAAKALSQGQFGQFPLYAFTSEGVWALEVSSSGSYTARQPITRDVCINPDSITQLDSAVLFATDRGIMMISGSLAQPITDVIKSEHPYNILQLSGMDKLHSMIGHKSDTCFPLIPLRDFLATCGMIYDYQHQRLIVYNPNRTYAYVYSFRSQQWGMMHSNINKGINSYPEALSLATGVDSDNNPVNHLVDFSTTDETVSNGLFVTRPIKLETPDVLKTISTIIQRGHFRKGAVKCVLYGSRDLYNWQLIWSSQDHYLRGFRGTPYKYFRVACVTSLAPDESIFGASIEFEPRLTNHLR